MQISNISLTDHNLALCADEDGLSDDDINNIIMFALRLDSHLLRTAFNGFHCGFSHRIGLQSKYHIQRLVDNLTKDMKPVQYDCCIKSCCLYVGEHKDLDQCPTSTCKEPRYHPGGTRAQQTFLYIPIIPHLQGMFSNPSLVKTLRYRATYDEKEHKPGHVCDVFDSTHYRSLLHERVVVNNEKLPYRYFDGKNDIALGLAGDEIQIFKRVRRGNATITPIILVNYNLPPSIYTHLEHVLCIGVVPGPRGPKDLNSFL